MLDLLWEKEVGNNVNQRQREGGGGGGGEGVGGGGGELEFQNFIFQGLWFRLSQNLSNNYSLLSY